MTEIISGFAQSHLGHAAFEPIDESADQHWQQHLINQLPMGAAQWAHSQGPSMNGIAEYDLNMFHHDPHGYTHQQYNGGHPSIVSPSLGYAGSDMDTAGTPSSTSFGDVADSFPSVRIPTSNHLQPPHRGSGATYSPHSSIGGISPHELPLSSPQQERPGISRAVTDPEHGPRKSTAPSHKSAGARPLRNSDEDEDYMPSEDPKRGRKRQRIPHTAVERRYRENLNAHLDKLRETVPSLAARKGPDGSKVDGGQGVKPSKCEILNGAIEHIGSLDKQISDLKGENQALRARMEQMQNWYRANSR